MWHRYAKGLHQLIHDALNEAGRRGRDAVSAGDFALALLERDNAARRVIQRLTDLEGLRSELDGLLPRQTPPLERAMRLAPDARDALSLALEEAIGLKERFVGSEHLLLAILREPERFAPAPLKRRISYAQARAEVVDFTRNGWDSQPRSQPWRFIRGHAHATLEKARLMKRVFIDISIANPKFFSNPYPLYERLRKIPIRRDPVVGFWIVTRYSEVAAILRNPQFVREMAPFMPPASFSQNLPAAVRRDLSPLSEHLAEIMLFQDPPRHTRLRGLVSAAFTGNAVNAMQPRIQAIADALLDRVDARKDGEMDLIRDLAYPLPTMVIAEMLGVPPEDHERLKHWSDEVSGLLTSTNSLEEDRHGGASLFEMRDYFASIVEKKLRLKPNNTLLSALAAAEAQGEKLSETELYANAILLLAAGNETTTNLIGNGMLALLRNRDQLETLRNNPAMMSGAIEELLRYDSPVQWTSRVCGADVELGGTAMRPGDFVLMSLGSANRDPAQFANPDRLDLSRAENRHLAFGQGIHYCLGATLARIEGAIAIGALLRRYPNLSLPSQKLHYRRSRPLRGLLKLRLRI